MSVGQVAHFKADKTRLAQELKACSDGKTTDVNQLTFRSRPVGEDGDSYTNSLCVCDYDDYMCV